MLLFGRLEISHKGATGLNRRHIKKESEAWVRKGIITQDQQAQILELYPSTKEWGKLLPILASILIGCSLLTFIASNWDQIDNLIKLALIIFVMTAFYLTGDQQIHKGQHSLGVCLLGLGLISFGAGMILVGQMFHLSSYNASTFILWCLAGICLLFFYSSTVLYLLTCGIAFVGQYYTDMQFNQISVVLFLITFLGLGFYWLKHQTSLTTTLFLFVMGGQIYQIIFHLEKDWIWAFLTPLLFYLAGEWFTSSTTATLFRLFSLINLFVIAAVMVFQPNSEPYGYHAVTDVGVYLGILTFLLLFSVLKKSKNKNYTSLWELFLYLPFFTLPYSSLFYLIGLFILSSYLIWHGDRLEHKEQTQLGIAGFLLSTLFGYFQYAWDFMDKSLFFLVGGVLLFFIHLSLRKRKNIFHGRDNKL
jgi:uncharacterized membrane protein